MTSKSSRSVLSMEEYKEVLTEGPTLEKPYLESGHLYPENELLPRPLGFKGSKDIVLRGDMASRSI